MYNEVVSMKCEFCDIEEHYYSFEQACDNDWSYTIENGRMVDICPHCIEKRVSVNV